MARKHVIHQCFGEVFICLWFGEPARKGEPLLRQRQQQQCYHYIWIRYLGQSAQQKDLCLHCRNARHGSGDRSLCLHKLGMEGSAHFVRWRKHNIWRFRQPDELPRCNSGLGRSAAEVVYPKRRILRTRELVCLQLRWKRHPHKKNHRQHRYGLLL